MCQRSDLDWRTGFELALPGNCGLENAKFLLLASCVGIRPGCLIQSAADDWEIIDPQFKVIGRIRLDSEETLGLNDHRFVPLGQFSSGSSDPQL